MEFEDVALASRQIAATPGRLDKTELLADLLRRTQADELPIVVAYLSGHLRQGRIGLGWAALRDAVATAAEPPPSGERTLFDADTAPAAPTSLSLGEVDAVFDRLAATTGARSGAARTAALRALFPRTGTAGREFLTRLVLGELRQGALGALMEEAIARATGVPLPRVRRAAMLSGDLEAVAAAARSGGAQALDRFRLEVFRPVQPMLAQPVADLDEALARLGTAALEWKLDGARIQVHRRGDEVRVYSRQLNDVTAAVPEVVAAVRALPVREAVLDGEVIALARDGRPLPFQLTMRRFGRSLDVAAAQAELPLATFLFDVLHLDGEDMIDAPARERWALLRRVAPALAVPQVVTTDGAEAVAFYDGALARGHEGVMAKALDAHYEAGGRGFAWLKVKAAHTLDLVVLAAEWGSGRRTGKLSNIHLGARDPATGGFVMLGKTFKGMTDALLDWQTMEFPKLETRREGHIVYLRPEIVVEVAFNDVQESPRYPGGMALRLARVKAYRPDKRPDEVDTLDTVRAILAGERAKRRDVG